MSNIYGILNTARVSIMSQQTGIQVTGQNLANVNTEDYSRQLVTMESSSTGVRVREVKRAADGFITSQLNDSSSNQSYYKTTEKALNTIETIFSVSSGKGLTQNIDNFFNAFHDLSVNAKGVTERSAVISQASILTDNMRRLAGNLKKVLINMDGEVKAEVSKANATLTEIANLNRNIHQAESPNVHANELRDKRDQKIKELAGIMDISVYKDTGNGELIITTPKGRRLVMGETAYTLSTAVNGNNKGLMDIKLNDGAGGTANITNEINGGSFYGFIHIRDTVVPDYQDRLDKLAAGIVREVNRLHSSGYDLNQRAGLNFFNPLSVTARVNVNNGGNASITGAVGQQGLVSTDNYEVLATSGGSFTLNNLTTGNASGTYTFSSGSAVNLGNGLIITLTGSVQAGDKFTFSSSEDAAMSMSVNSVVSDNSNRVAAGGTLFAGDGTNATAIAELQTSLTFSGNTLLAGSGAVTFNDYYGGLIGDMGIESTRATQGVEHNDAVHNQLFAQRENLAGVSVDEEMINMIKFQQAFNAAAKLLVTTQEMLNSLQQAV